MLRTLVLLCVVTAGCSSGGGGSETERRPAKAAADAAPSKRGAPNKADAPAGDRWTGTFEGRTEPTPAPLPSRNVAPNAPAPDAGAGAPAWTGNGTVAFVALGEDVAGTLEGGGLSCKVTGTLVAGKLRGWLATDAPSGARLMGNVEGVMEGAPQGEGLRGTWRVSTSAGVEVRAGTFEARKAN